MEKNKKRAKTASMEYQNHFFTKFSEIENFH